jgi:hypothetical protein
VILPAPWQSNKIENLQFVVEYPREYESIFKTALAHESVGPGVLFDEKARGQKSRETVSLMTWTSHFSSLLFFLYKKCFD